MKKGLLVLIFFSALTAVFTYPLVFEMDSALSDRGDPLLNTWILASNTHQLTTDPASLFHANIFHPFPNTLAYSEHLLASTALAFPVIALTGNSVLGHNVVVLLSFVLSGIGMYLLATHLTGNRIAGIASGIIFAFCPFRFEHMGHLQLLTIQWMPFTFLYLHRFFEKETARDLILFTLFLILQALSCGYYAVYLGMAAGFFILWNVSRRMGTGRRAFHSLLLKLALFAAVTLLVLYPVYRPYHRVNEEMGFERSLAVAGDYSADFRSYLATPSFNHLYGSMMDRFGGPEKRLFPGALAIILSACGLLAYRRKQGDTTEGGAAHRGAREARASRDRTGRGGSRARSRWLHVVEVLLLLSIAVAVAIYFTGGFSLEAGGLRLSCRSLRNPIILAAVFLAVRQILNRDRRPFLLVSLLGRLASLTRIPQAQGFYLVLLLACFMLSLGPSFGVYSVFYKVFRPFQGMRAVSRWGIMVIFCLSVLSAYGIAYLAGRIPGRRRWRTSASVLLVLVLLAEYASFPLKFWHAPREVPAVYEWLAGREEDAAIVELPMPLSAGTVFREAKYMYFSTFHWKQLVNGYSGFFPPTYWTVNRVMQTFPSPASIDMIDVLGVRYVVLHLGKFDRKRRRRIEKELPRTSGRLELEFHSDSDYVYRVEAGKSETAPIASREVSTAGWSAKATHQDGLASLAFDGDIGTRWNSAALQEPGMVYEVDTGVVRTLTGLSLLLGSSPDDYPRDLEVRTSSDGSRWTEIEGMFPLSGLVRSYLDGVSPRIDLAFSPVEARYVRLVQRGQDGTYFWSIHELKLYETGE